MNSWRIDFIHQNLPSLVKVTRCTESLKVHLLSKGLLSPEDVEIITTEARNYGDTRAACKLYSILETRTDRFFGFMDALKETRQIGAWHIFRSGIQEKLSTVPVKLSGELLPLNEHFSSWTHQDAQGCLDSEGSMMEFCEVPSDDKILIDIDEAFLNIKPHPLYIPRFVSNRILLNANAFKETCEDVFVLNGIDRYDLAELVDPFPVRSSSNQLTMITCRHIYLEDDEDWDDLRDAAVVPLHLVCKEENQYVLQKSTQITDTILNNSSKLKRHEEAYMSEDKFTEEIVSSQDTKGFCICDIPGMGKTWLLESMARKLQSLSKQTIVIFIQLSAFGKSLGGLPLQKDPLTTIFEVTSFSKLASCILKSHAKRSNLKFMLILDGFDEISEEFVEITTAFFKKLITEDNVRLIISSRPRMRKHLEETFKVISYDILAFGREEQVSAIVNQWQLSIQDRELELRQYAEQCIRVFKKIECEDSNNILGVPLKCFILAEVQLKHAKKLSTRKKPMKVAEEALAKSGCDLYEKFFESRMFKVLMRDSSDLITKTLYFHTHQALKLLMPKMLLLSVDCYFSEKCPPSNFVEEVAVKIGIINLDSNSQFAFLHRTFAEYFVGKFFAEFWKNLDDFDNSSVRSVGIYFVQNLLSSTNENESHYWLRRKAKFSFPFFKSSYKEKSVWFHNNRTIIWFMNSLLHTDRAIVNIFREALQSPACPHQPEKHLTHFTTMLKDQVYTTLITCIDEQFRDILYLFLKIVQVFFDPCEIFQIIDENEYGTAYLLYVIALRGSPETAYEIFKIFSNCPDKYLLKFCDKFPLDYISPLEVSILGNDADMFAFLSSKVNMHMERLILACLMGEKFSRVDIIRRVDIFRRILAVSKDKMWTVNTNDLEVYLESLNISDGPNFTKWIEFAFHHNLSLYELPRSNKLVILKSTLNEVDDVQIFQLLHLLFEKNRRQRCAFRDESKLDAFPFKAEETLQTLNLTEAMVTFALFEQHGLQFHFGSIKKLETLRILLQVLPNVKKMNRKGMNYLHLAAKKGALDWIEYLVKAGHSVDEKDDDGGTPMFHVKANDTRCVKVIHALIENGADIYARKNDQQNIALFLLNPFHFNWKVVTKFVEYTLERENYQLWTMQDRFGNTAYQLLSRYLAGGSYESIHPILLKNQLKRLSRSKLDDCMIM